MSYKTLLQGCNSDLQSILDQIEALEPNSSYSPYTCTVMITVSGGTYIDIIVCSIVDATGKVVTEEDTPYSNTITISNVLCGSIVYIETGLTYFACGQYTDGMEFILGAGNSAVFTAPTTPNITGIINIEFK